MSYRRPALLVTLCVLLLLIGGPAEAQSGSMGGLLPPIIPYRVHLREPIPNNLPSEGILAGTPADQEAERRIQAALATKGSLELNETPLEELAKLLHQRLGIPVSLDRKALKEGAVALDTPLTFRAADMTYDTLLRYAIKDLELTSIIANESLLITTTTEADNLLQPRMYPVQDLVLVRRDNYYTRDIGSLEHVLKQTISPQSWRDIGGYYSLSDDRNVLVIAQVSEVHRYIADALRAIRTVRAQQAPTYYSDNRLCVHGQISKTLPNTGVLAGTPTAVRRDENAQAALEAKVRLAAATMPLDQFADFVQQRLGCPVLLDRKALEGGGVPTDTPIDLTAGELSMRSMLAQALTPHQLTWLVRDEALLITTRAEADTLHETRVYAVQDLVLIDQGGYFKSDSEKLIVMLKEHILPQTWAEIGGTGVACYACDVLVVSTTRQVHDAIANFLGALRQARRMQAEEVGIRPATKRPPAPSRPRRRLFGRG